MVEEASKSGNFSVVASRESTLASRPPDRLCEGARLSVLGVVEYGMATRGSIRIKVHRGGRGTEGGEGGAGGARGVVLL